MAQQNRTVLKSYFETGDTPTEAQFIDFIDSSPNIAEGEVINVNDKRVLESQGDDIASANNLILDSALNGNVYVITGTTQMNLIEDLDWQDGSKVTLQFAGVLIISHGAAASGDFKPIYLAKGSDYTTTAGDTFTFVLINGEWWEVSNTKESGGGGSGGHIYKENGVVQATREGRNVITNGSKTVFTDDPTNDETDEEWQFEVGTDVDPTGKQDGDVWGYNNSTSKTEPVQTKLDQRILTGVPEVVSGLVDTTQTLLSTIQQAGYEVKGYINNDSAVAITGLVITDGTTNLFTPIDFIANEKGKKFTIPDSYFDPDNDKDFYYYVTTGNAANVTIYFTSILNSPE